MAEIETWALVAFTGALVLIEALRSYRAWRDERLRVAQRKIAIAMEMQSWTWKRFRVAGDEARVEVQRVLDAAGVLKELTAILEFPDDNVIENDVRVVLGGLMELLRGTSNVDKAETVERVKERMSWGVMGWVEESERLRHPLRSWWARVRPRRGS